MEHGSRIKLCLMDVVAFVRGSGGVASRAQVRAAGHTDRSVRRAIERGQLRRVRTGWYAGEAPPAIIRAIEAGGVLSCVSALRLQGVWTMPDEEVHVRVQRGTAAAGGRGVRVHWSDERRGSGFPVDAPADAIRCLIRCADRRAAVVALDSAVNTRLITEEAMLAVLAESARGRSLLPLVDPRSESGLETIVRLALRRLRVRVRSQVGIAGVGRVDLVIGDRLVLELDGAAWHDRAGDFERDRARDRALTALGYVVMRASYRQVMTNWSEIEGQILTVIRRGGHRWPRRR